MPIPTQILLLSLALPLGGLALAGCLAKAPAVRWKPQGTRIEAAWVRIPDAPRGRHRTGCGRSVGRRDPRETLKLHELDGYRALVTQLVIPTATDINDGDGVMRFGTLRPGDPGVSWLGWLPLPKGDRAEGYFHAIYSDSDGWHVTLQTDDGGSGARYWARIDPPAGLAAPLHRWLDEP